MQKHVSTAKITKPSVSGIFQRERLFQLLDDNRKRCVVWVSGPAGSGKTTLVASYLDARNLPCLWYIVDQGDADIATFFSYIGRAAEKQGAGDRPPLPLLTPEYLQGIPTFTKRYFENLCARFNPPFTLIFDNYQDVSDGSDFHDMIVCGLDVVPDGINVIILSRNEPPRQFARLRANNKINFIGWNEIRFTREESREVVRMYGQENLTDEALAEVYRKTEGWMAGLVLFLEGTKRAGIESSILKTLVPETVFDYFAGEIFERTDRVTQEFLLKTSLLPSMNALIAEKLTGVRTTAEILSRLYKSHYFIEMRAAADPVYHYHPLFREFLLSKMKSILSPEEQAALSKNAAFLLEDSGQIEHAVFLLTKAGEWNELVRVILAHAQALTAQGRGRTVQEWLMSLPEDIVGKTPWILYWMGICAMPFNLAESRGSLECAFHAFKREKNADGLFLSWAGVVNTLVYEWGDFNPLDYWISEMESVLREYPLFPSSEIEVRVTYAMFSALLYRRPQHPDVQLWEKRMQEIAVSVADIRLQAMAGNQLILYNTWGTGRPAKAAFLIDALKSVSKSREADPLSYTVWCAFKATYYWLVSAHEECVETINEGLKTAEETGIHVSDPVLWSVGAMVNTTSGNLEEAQVFLDKMAASITPKAYCLLFLYHYSASFAALYKGDSVKACEHGQAALDSSVKGGMVFGILYSSFALGTALLERGESAKGLAYLADTHKIAASTKSHAAEYLALVTEGHYFLERGEERRGIDAVAKAMTIGKQEGYLNHSAWRPSVMALLCAKALENEIETDYVRDLIRKRKLAPSDLAQPNVQSAIRNLQLEAWPWPLKIHTLGKFEIVKDGVPVTFSGKVQQKPLALLKAIIAFGGRDVSRQRLIDALWPEADGAQANKSFEAALHRLRRLMDNDKAVLLTQGMLTIDSRYCWIDVFAFETITGQADEEFQFKRTEDNVKRAIQLTDRIFNLYKGHFLEREAEQSWTIAARERMRTKFLDCIGRSARYLQRAGQHEKAIEYLEKGLERDSTYEEFYQELMSCYYKLGRSAAVGEVHRRCCKVLSATLGTEPSAKTEEIYTRISQSFLNS